MAAERTRMVSRHYLEYLKKKLQNNRTGKKVTAPLDAMTFDRVELSTPPSDRRSDYTWLATYINDMSNDEVSRKMKRYRQTFSTVDEALTDKVILELL